jgi:hypothetical protein
VWRAVARLGDYKIRDFVWPEGVFALFIGVGGAVLIVKGTKLAERLDVAGDVLTLAGALLAVVFTALALVVSIPSQDYIRKMAETPNGGILRFLDPFLVAVGTQVTIVLLGLAYKLAAAHVPKAVEHAAFYTLGFLLTFGLLDVVALARSLVRHGVNRGVEAAASGAGDSVPRLDQRRRGE